MTRFFKQLIYGGSFLFILFLIIGYIAYVNLRHIPTCFDGIQNQDELGIDCDGSCALRCVLKDLKPIDVSSVLLGKNNEDTVRALIPLRNLNSDFGLPRFDYAITLYGEDDAVVASINNTSFIYPGEIKYLVEPAISVSAPVVRSTFKISGVTYDSWRSVEDFSIPKSQVRNLQFVRDEEHDELQVTGLFVNTDTTTLSQVTVTVLLYNTLGFQSGFSSTALQTVRPREERFFKVIVPGVNFDNLKENDTKFYLELER